MSWVAGVGALWLVCAGVAVWKHRKNRNAIDLLEVAVNALPDLIAKLWRK